jgi:hypothetical protein
MAHKFSFTHHKAKSLSGSLKAFGGSVAGYGLEELVGLILGFLARTSFMDGEISIAVTLITRKEGSP